jgi:tetratricopeptide (TPR) repeat protein
MRVLARLELEEGRAARARRLLERCLRMRGELEDSRDLPLALTNQGWLAMFEGDGTRAEELLQEAVARSPARDEEWDVAVQLVSLAQVALQRGDVGAATSQAKESLRIFAEHGFRYGVGPERRDGGIGDGGVPGAARPDLGRGSGGPWQGGSRTPFSTKTSFGPKNICSRLT